jgi:hypothetical protein
VGEAEKIEVSSKVVDRRTVVSGVFMGTCRAVSTGQHRGGLQGVEEPTTDILNERTTCRVSVAK